MMDMAIEYGWERDDDYVEEPDEDYLEYERERVRMLAYEELNSARASAPPIVTRLAEEVLAKSYDVEGEPDMEWEDGELVLGNGSLREVFRGDSRSAIAEGWRRFRQAIAGAPLLLRHLRRFPQRHTRHVGRVARRRRTVATRGSPGDDSEPEPPPLARRSPRQAGLPALAAVAR
jgi:hypothetical protein